MLKFFAKRLIPFIASSLDLDVDTVQKASGVYLRIRIEAFGMVLLDRLIKVSEASNIDNPIDIFEPAGALRLPEGSKDVLNATVFKDLKPNK